MSKRMRGKMTVCDDGHSEIVYTNKECPMCKAIEKIGELKSKIVSLDVELNELVNGENA